GVGLLPAALSTGIGSQVQKPLAVVVGAGMMVAPGVILLTLPALISLFSRRTRRGVVGDLSPAEGWISVMGGVAVRARFGRAPGFRFAGIRLACAAFGLLATAGHAAAETMADALVRTYQTNPQLNAERARQRGTDENVPQALAGYRPQLVASLSSGLQAVRNILPDNTVQGATLKPWTIGLTVTQVLFNGYKTANNVRV